MGHQLHQRSRRLVLGLAVFALLLGSVASPPASLPAAAQACSAQVVLDPGHGGTDPGAVNESFGLVEKELNLVVAEQAAAILWANGYTVALTRESNETTLGNSERGEIANVCGAEVLVSIHFNALSDPSVNYTKTFWGKPRKDEAFSVAMHDALWPALSVDAAGEPTNLTDGAVGQFANGALLQAEMPATLAETVFMSNDEEAARLAAALYEDGTRLTQIARAIAAGVAGWLGPTETNQAPVANDDAYRVAENETLVEAAPGVLGNDSDPDGDPLTATLVGDASGGALTLNPDGSFSYTPHSGTSSDRFSYVANDGTADSNIATVTITVTETETAPTEPAAPSDLTATQSAVQGRNATINLTWIDHATNEDGYRLYRSDDGGTTWNPIQDNLAASSTAASDRVKTGATYHYAVAAFNAAGESDWSTATLEVTENRRQGGGAAD